MTAEPRTLKPAKVTLVWRRYGPGIEWSATIDPPPFANYERLFEWHHEPPADGSHDRPDPLYRAAFKLGQQVHNLGVHANPFAVVEQPSVRDAPVAGDFDGTCGELHEDGLEIRFFGACPVQGMGHLDGRFCYYRARGTGWRLQVWAEGVDVADDGLPEPEPEWWHGDPEAYAFPDGGWLHHDVSIANLREALAAWRAR